MADTETPAAPSSSPSDHAESLDKEVIDGSDHKPLQREPAENDVVLRESMLVANHPGNEELLRIVRERLEEYAARPRLEKPMVAVDILNQWRAQGRRFLKKDKTTGQWQDIGDKKAHQKISKALQTQKTEQDRNKAPKHTVAETTSVSKSRRSRRISTKLDYTREDSKLYGRSKEQEELGRIYSRLKDSISVTDLVLILGEAGTGKTALAHSLQSTVEREGGFFVQAKFEVFSESTAAFVTAFSDFVNQLTVCDEQTVGRYRKAIQQVVDEEGHLLSSLVPPLATVLGQQEKYVVETGQGAQASKRIKYVFRSFLRAISSPEHPLVILLDDLQWASEASLALLAFLVGDAANHGVLFLGTCRDDPSTDTCLLRKALAEFDSTQVNIHSIRLGNLDEDAVRDMIADTLLIESDQTTSISQLIVSMTCGNAFFILALLRSLQDEELLRFDEDTMQWACDSHMIRVTVEARTVDDLFKTKIKDLPVDVQETLRIASCLGSRIEQYLLQKIVTGDISSHLNMAAAKGLLTFDNSNGAFVFAHDGIQQTTYSLIPADDKVSFHLMIGRKLWRMLDDSELETYIFVILRQLMLGDHLVTDQKERTATASLCLRAGEKAVALSNFETASVYLKHGIFLLGPRLWRDSYVRSLQLHNAAAEVSYCTAQFDDVEKYVHAVLLNARSFQDTLHARSTHIYALGSRGRAQEAIENGLTTLKHLGEKLPSNPSIAQFRLSMWKTKRLLRNRSNAAILRLPAMTDAEKVATMQILNLIYFSALVSRPLLAGLVAARMVRLTTTHGVCAVSSVGFGFYAMQLCGGGSNIDDAYRYGKLAMQMYSEFTNEAWLCRVSAVYYGCICTWKEPVQVTFEPLKHAYHVGLGTGDIEYAMLCACVNCWNNSNRFTLEFLENELEALGERMAFLGQTLALMLIRPLWQFVHNFAGRAGVDPTILTGEIVDQDALMAEAKESSRGLLAWTRFYCMVLAYFFGDYDSAEQYATTSHMIYDNSFGSGVDAGSVLFYECMVLLAVARNGKRRHIAAVRRRLKRLAHWAEHCPLNFLGKQYMIEAELAAVTGNHLSVLSKYTSSILLSREGGFLMEEALANERAGKYYLERGDNGSALKFFRESYKLYERWGGIEKMRHLQREVQPIQLCNN